MVTERKTAQENSGFNFGIVAPGAKLTQCKRALITGITGQDGSYLADLLLSKGYEVYGLERRLSIREGHHKNIQHLINENRIIMIPGDLTDQNSISNAIEEAQPDEVYNLAAQSFVQASWSQPKLTADVTGTGALLVLESIRMINKNIRFYQASSSEMFGKVTETPQNEHTSFYPRSPYGVAKLYAHWITVNYRESYGIFAASGILFNHESPRRGQEFVTRKIVKTAVDITKGLAKELRLGNPDAKRDWGYAKEYVEAMWLMLQQDEPGDFVISTGETHTIREFAELVFKKLQLNTELIKWNCPEFTRPAEVDLLVGDASKAQEVLGWKPVVKFEELINIMVEAELKNY